MPRRFTLLDDEYFAALVHVVRAFEDADLPVALVGGGAAQAWIASLRTASGRVRLADEPALRVALRRTRDLDFATRAGEADALALLNALAATLPGGGHVLGPRAMRLGGVSIALTLEPADLSGMTSLYDAFLDGRTSVELRAGAAPISVPIVSLPHLLVTKLTRRGDKAKDLVDVTELLAAAAGRSLEIDFAAVRELLAGRPEALALLDDIDPGAQDPPQG